MTPQTPVLREEAFHELRRGPETSTAAREPSARASFLGSLAALARDSRAALDLLLCGRKRFWKKSLGSLAAETVSKFGPPCSSSGYIYIC